MPHLSSLRKFTIPPLDTAAEAAARKRQDSLTKPPGSLGVLEDIACRMAAVQGNPRPVVRKKWVVVAAADHGVTAEGVSPYPPEVTAQMVANFLRGGAAISVLARAAGAEMVIVDAGVAGGVPGDASPEHPESPETSSGSGPGLRRFAALAPSAADRGRQAHGGEGPRRGASSMARGPAMSRAEAERLIEAGAALSHELALKGADIIATGDMGIGNTTAAAALTAVFTGRPPSELTGRGAGVDDAGLRRKIAVVERALEVNQPDAGDPVGALAAVGGYEIAALAGVILGAAEKRVAVALDGFIATSAALVAQGIEPRVTDYCFACHLSVEPGHRAALAKLKLRPLLDLGMRLGEGTGAALGMQVIEAAVRLHNEMATFEEAAVSNRQEAAPDGPSPAPVRQAAPAPEAPEANSGSRSGPAGSGRRHGGAPPGGRGPTGRKGRSGGGA